MEKRNFEEKSAESNENRVAEENQHKEEKSSRLKGSARFLENLWRNPPKFQRIFPSDNLSQTKEKLQNNLNYIDDYKISTIQAIETNYLKIDKISKRLNSNFQNSQELFDAQDFNGVKTKLLGIKEEIKKTGLINLLNSVQNLFYRADNNINIQNVLIKLNHVNHADTTNIKVQSKYTQFNKLWQNVQNLNESHESDYVHQNIFENVKSGFENLKMFMKNNDIEIVKIKTKDKIASFFNTIKSSFDSKSISLKFNLLKSTAEKTENLYLKIDKYTSALNLVQNNSAAFKPEEFERIKNVIDKIQAKIDKKLLEIDDLNNQYFQFREDLNFEKIQSELLPKMQELKKLGFEDKLSELKEIYFSVKRNLSYYSSLRKIDEKINSGDQLGAKVIMLKFRENISVLKKPEEILDSINSWAVILDSKFDYVPTNNQKREISLPIKKKKTYHTEEQSDLFLKFKKMTWDSNLNYFFPIGLLFFLL
jgi:hypothetical protein